MLVIFWITVGSYAIWQMRAASKEGQLFLNIFIVSFLVRLAIAIGHHAFGLFVPDSGKDAIEFHAEAEQLFQTLSLADLLQFWEITTTHGSYPIFLALLYKLFLNPNEYIGIAINFLLYGSTLILISKSQRILANDLSPVARRIFLALAFSYPMAAFYSVILLRESIFIFVCAYSVYVFSAVSRSGRITAGMIFRLVALNILACVLHIGYLLFFLGITGLTLASLRGNKIRTQTVRATTIAAITIVAIAATSAQYYGGYLNTFVRADDPLDKYLYKYENIALTTKSRYGKEYTNSLSHNLMVAYPIDVARFNFLPSAIDISSLRSAPFAWQSVILYLFLLSLPLLAWKKSTRIAKWLLALYILSITMFVLGSTNYIQAVRHKTKFFPLVVLLLPASRTKKDTSMKAKANWRIPA